MIPYFLIRGLPGVGKSTIVDRYRNIIPIIDPDLLHIDNNKALSRTARANLKYRQNLKTAITLLNANKSFFWVQPWSKVSGISITVDNINCLISSGIKAFPIIITLKAPIFISYRRHLCRTVPREKLTYKEYTYKYVQEFEDVSSYEITHIDIRNYLQIFTVRKFSKIINSYLSLQ